MKSSSAAADSAAAELLFSICAVNNSLKSTICWISNNLRNQKLENESLLHILQQKPNIRVDHARNVAEMQRNSWIYSIGEPK